MATRPPRRARRGANAIEFALILPVLVAIMTGIVDYGWVYLVRTAAVTAAREGARAGALTPQDETPSVVAADVAADTWTGLGLPLTPTMVAFQSGAAPNEVMVVRVRVDLVSLVGFVVGPSNVEITATRLMADQP